MGRKQKNGLTVDAGENEEEKAGWNGQTGKCVPQISNTFWFRLNGAAKGL